jgi:predicted kinase
MNRPNFTLLVGLPRSGKSTWIQKNGGNAIVVSNDWIREEILGTHYSKNANAIIWTIADAALRIVLGQGKDAIYDGVNLTKETRKFYIDLARQYGAKIKMVLILTPLETCIERNKVGQKLPIEVLQKMADSFESPDPEEYDEIDVIYNGKG